MQGSIARLRRSSIQSSNGHVAATLLVTILSTEDRHRRTHRGLPNFIRHQGHRVPHACSKGLRFKRLVVAPLPDIRVEEEGVLKVRNVLRVVVLGVPTCKKPAPWWSEAPQEIFAEIF